MKPDCQICDHPARSHRWAFSNASGTVYRYRRCRACQARRRRYGNTTPAECPGYRPKTEDGQ